MFTSNKQVLAFKLFLCCELDLTRTAAQQEDCQCYTVWSGVFVDTLVRLGEDECEETAGANRRTFTPLHPATQERKIRERKKKKKTSAGTRTRSPRPRMLALLW